MFNYSRPSNQPMDHNHILRTWGNSLWTLSFTKILGYLVLTVIVLVNALLNLRVICIVCSGLRMRYMSSRLLIVQVSVISIGITIVPVYEIVRQLGLLQDQNLLSCGQMDFLKTVLICALPTNMAAIFFDAARNFDQYQTVAELLIYRILSLVWIPAIFQGLPYLLMSATYPDLKNWNECIPIPDIGNRIYYMLIKTIQFLLFSFGVSIYIINVLTTIRHKLQNLYGRLPNARRRLENQILTTRFLCIHFVAFISIWVPVELVFLFIEILKLLSSVQDEISTENSSTYTNCILSTYLAINACINLTLLENNMNIWPGWCYCWCICLPQRTFRDNDLQRAQAEITRPSIVRTGRREEYNVASTSRHVSGAVSVQDISRVTSIFYDKPRRLQESISMIDIVDLTRRTARESREISSENSTSDGILKETLV